VLRKIELAALHWFERFERPVAWVMFAGALVTFVGVFTGLIATGQFRLLTMVAAADLGYTGYSALREAYDSESETG
jgi:hypothetical protein